MVDAATPAFLADTRDVAALGESGQEFLLPLQSEFVTPLPAPLKFAAITANNTHQPDPSKLRHAAILFGSFCQGSTNLVTVAMRRSTRRSWPPAAPQDLLRRRRTPQPRPDRGGGGRARRKSTCSMTSAPAATATPSGSLSLPRWKSPNRSACPASTSSATAAQSSTRPTGAVPCRTPAARAYPGPLPRSLRSATAPPPALDPAGAEPRRHRAQPPRVRSQRVGAQKQVTRIELGQRLQTPAGRE